MFVSACAYVYVCTFVCEFVRIGSCVSVFVFVCVRVFVRDRE